MYLFGLFGQFNKTNIEMELFRSIFPQQQQQTTPKQKFSHPQNQAAKCEKKSRIIQFFITKLRQINLV